MYLLNKMPSIPTHTGYRVNTITIYDSTANKIFLFKSDQKLLGSLKHVNNRKI